MGKARHREVKDLPEVTQLLIVIGRAGIQTQQDGFRACAHHHYALLLLHGMRLWDRLRRTLLLSSSSIGILKFLTHQELRTTFLPQGLKAWEQNGRAQRGVSRVLLWRWVAGRAWLKELSGLGKIKLSEPQFPHMSTWSWQTYWMRQ